MRYCLEEPRTSENELLKMFRLIRFEDIEAHRFGDLSRIVNYRKFMKHHEKEGK